MKPKTSFPGKLLLFRRLVKLKIRSLKRLPDSELYFAVGLILLWLLVFTLTHVKLFPLYK
jgi:hypothetical protein